ncbi:MAG: NADH-quinone oxidoreductase subunit J [Anaerolineales bacterium]|jgi:NADH-quinone oxidoreductase subunit J
MNWLFYLAAVVALFCSVMVITRLNAVHALLYMVMSLLSVALIFFLLGAPFVAALEVIIYAGAIMVLFVFVIMMLNLGPQSEDQERRWFNLRTWRGLVIVAGILLIELIVAIRLGLPQQMEVTEVSPHQVALSLFGPYLLGVELASMLLLAGLVGAYHLGRRKQSNERNV